MSDPDAMFMQQALVQARDAAASGEAPVGAVVVIGGEVVAAAHNTTVTEHDPSAHAEIVVLREAGRKQGNHRLVDATLYVTLEPCAMCTGAIVQARLPRVVFGAYDPKAGALGSAIDLSDSRAFNHRFEVQGGLMAEECGAVLKEFFSARR
jgi:tRNA(adenine34) deaminase